MKTIKKIAILLMIFLGILAISNNVKGAVLQDQILYCSGDIRGYTISGFIPTERINSVSAKIYYWDIDQQRTETVTVYDQVVGFR